MRLSVWLARDLVVTVICCGFMALSSTDAIAQASQTLEKRIALVIGNSNYVNAPLANPVNDVHLLQTTLTALGFDVIQRVNLDANGMRAAIRDFGARLRESPGAVGLFYYAGHGVQFKGVNYLVPVGQSYTTEAEIEDSALNLDTVLRRIQEGGSKISFVVLDACRNNPFAKVASRSLRTMLDGLARVDAPSGTLIAYSTAPGAVASDGAAGNGLYTQHLVRNMKVPGITAEQMFKRTREGVEIASANQQSPREESSLKGADFMFLPVEQGRKVNPELVELTYWESIRSSPDSGNFDAYLKDYPNGRFALLARQSRERLLKLGRADPGLAQLASAHSEVLRGESVQAERVFQQLSAAPDSVDKARGKSGLAELALVSGQPDRANQLADEALQLRSNSVSALWVKAMVAYGRGVSDEAERLLTQATSSAAVADFPIQKAKAMIALGNLKRKDKPEAATAAYEEALKVDGGNIDALTNLATVLRETGNPTKALEWLKSANVQTTSGGDRVLDALGRQIEQDLAERRDFDRQKQIDESVRDLVIRFKDLKVLPRPANQDAWTSPPMAVSVLGFQDLGRSLDGRVGMDVLLSQELGRELTIQSVLVVDRTMIDKVLAELKLGASSLADPDTQLRLGRLTAARLIAVGRIFRLNGKDHVSFRLIDTETSQVVVNRTEDAGPAMDPIGMSVRLAKFAATEIQSKYPVKGRLVSVDGDGVILNLGRKNGLVTGDTFRVLGEAKPIEFNGKVIGTRESQVGSLRIASVDDQMAFAVPVDKLGAWTPTMRVVDARSSGNR